MTSTNIPTSRQIELAHAQRARRRRGITRAKILAGVFAAAFLIGLIGGVLAPGA